MITKALIIADPWIGYILDGLKTWEMRSSGASHREWFGLIRKGTGAIYGVARLVDVGAPLSPAEMVASIDRHRIPEAVIRSGEVAKWNTPWKLADVRRLARPVPYTHKSGAVTWVELDAAAIEGVTDQLGGIVPAVAATSSPELKRSAPGQLSRLAGSETVQIDILQRGRKLYVDVDWDDGHDEPEVSSPRAPRTPAAPTGASAKPQPTNGRAIGEVTITDGNIANSHIYLRSFFDCFPSDAVGGSNKASAAKRELTIDWGGAEPVVTDLDGSKRFFRARGWIGAFYKLNRAQAGDRVVVEQTAPYRYRVRLQKAGRWGQGA
ncbi:hypothetical protein [Tianweitania sediminis]|uniref:ASCH domain-containing protein n=1 Tax=Tianweitania sediminis TaxID=1502156 RepID=A0A8J7RMP8_9HYPH|nr:hypothetical protein [Tianweitania sediminis]MBP0439956.1 hypothetical protein [Tianweitania sediminis]